ncbi:excinuclease ABC subunit UvrC [Egibacter rhizosphaerae]|uniref:UvrABC system protein C n=1 Tax=Egibacter rhizosphaerae TaxID=1670831 RepID=A0A411YKL9_9ACTN|nr:excinuclease ABC subunit UvrC [Egibacter rhizosphaerae]QBI21764.1 excinuclease ABC subunit UvrC [Egibacter rhizosphaerae]
MASNPALAFKPEPGTIPTDPGCYLWRDRHGRVVYVGKAKSLRSRLSSYFQGLSQLGQRTRAMLEAAASVEWIVCSGEVEALHLEYNLIKEHRPRYNIRYTDDKSYPYLTITYADEVPRAMVRRNPRKDGSRYFGPYAHAYAIRETLDLLQRVFPVRTCSDGVYERCARIERPCLLYHIGRCVAPCVGHATPEEHRELVDDLIAFLEGDTDPVLDELTERMHAEAEQLNFEAAARIRDQLDAARKALAKQQMVTSRPEDFDAINLHEDELEAAFQAFFVRRGRVVGRKGWTVDKVEDLDTSQLVRRFLLDLGMEREDQLPRELLVPVEPDDADAVKAFLADLRGGPVHLRVPQRGEKVQLLDQIAENAHEAFTQHKLKRAQDFTSRSQALHDLQEHLGLDEAPLRIECYDISTLQGANSVASMVVLEDGLPRSNEYRRFKIQGVAGQDDFAMMREVITRRFKRFIEEASRPTKQRKFAYPPNLVLIDGGKGQLSAAREALADLGIEGVAVAALAKRLEEVYLPDRNDPVRLPRASEALYLLQRVRDEAHRFAVRYHRTVRGKEMTRSVFDEVPGIGPARRKALLDRFGSLKAVRQASVEDLTAVEGISETLARTIYDHLHGRGAAEGAEAEHLGDERSARG